VLRVVTDGLGGFLHFRVGAERMAGVRIAVEAGEVAAGNLDPNLVAGQENVARDPKVDLVAIDLPGLDRRRRGG